MKKIEIMGCGYIGLPTAITFTLAGYEVCGFDVKEEVVQKLNDGSYTHRRAGTAGRDDQGDLATGGLHFTASPSPRTFSSSACRRPTATRRRASASPR